MSSIKKYLDIVSENTSGAIASVSMPVGSTIERESTEENKTENPKVLEYGMWENSVLSTSDKLKKKRGDTKVVKSIYGESEIHDSKSKLESADSLNSRLATLLEQFNSNYNHNDDFRSWADQKDIEREIISIKNKLKKQLANESKLNELAPLAIPAAIAAGRAVAPAAARALAPYAARGVQAVRQMAQRPGSRTIDMGKAVEVPKTALPAPQSITAGSKPILPSAPGGTAAGTAASVAGHGALGGAMYAANKSTPVTTQSQATTAPTSTTNTSPSSAPKTPPKTYSKSVQSLANLNKISNPDFIRTGQTLKLPGGSNYTVQKGDTLTKIASMPSSSPSTSASATTPPSPISTSAIDADMSIPSISPTNSSPTPSSTSTSSSLPSTSTDIPTTSMDEAGKPGKKRRSDVKEDALDESDLILNPASLSKLSRDLISKKNDRHDHEVEMARSDLYHTGKNAAAVFSLLKHVTEQDGIEGWVQEKIIKAADYLNTVREYLEGKQMEVDETKPGLWANIHAKRERIKSGSGERMRNPGSKGAPTAKNFRDAAKPSKE